MIDALKGKKTYILAAASGIVTAAHMLGFIDAEMWASIMGLLGAGGLATLRAGVAK
jgi:hypothetical protein